MEVKMKTEVLSEHIIRRGISQRGFALRAGISSPYLTQILAGKKKPSGVVRQKLLAASGMDFDELFVISPYNTGDSTFAEESIR